MHDQANKARSRLLGVVPWRLRRQAEPGAHCLRVFLGDTAELISVQGMRWCADAPKMVSVASITAKVLREVHNNRLGETVNPVAALTTQTTKESMRLLEVRKKT